MDDLISRQKTIDAIWTHATRVLENSDYDIFIQDIYKMTHRHIAELIQHLPSAQPKMGRWVAREVVTSGKSIEDWQTARCSVCGFYHITPYLHYFDNFKYCPECGAKMEG